MLSLKELIYSSRNMSLYFLAALVPMIISLVLNPFVALYMEKEDFAIVGYFASFNLLFVPLMNFSFMQYYSRQYFHLEEEQREHLLNTIQWSQLIFGTIMMLVIAIAFYLYHLSLEIPISFSPFAIISLASLFLGTFYSNYLIKLKFERKAWKYFQTALCYAMLHAIGIIILVFALRFKAYGYMCAALLTCFFMAAYCLTNSLGKFQIDKNQLRNMLLFCWPLILANLMEYFYSGLDRAFLVHLNDNKELGVYNIAVTIGAYVTIFYTAISQTFQPDLFEAVAKKDIKATSKLIVKIQLLNIVPIILFILFCPIFIEILTFGKYTDATPYARIIALKGIFAAIYYSLSNVIVAGGQSKVTLFNKIIGTIAVYFAMSYMVSEFAYIGAAWGQALSYVVMIIISLVFLIYKRKEIFS